ncbi:hypothetical protein KC19_4G257100 [Ceratodon purpureus]|uniref:Fungal lipase-type domain-containing protein n=1 Tax=Ceratodon purpureus TaxID=3225 RepID=A0A8T0IG90_CERPU|nr:hypothetical protein KC19_4G257100 [Ceratodon purpureus]
MASLSVMLRQPTQCKLVGVHGQGCQELHVATSSRALVSLPTMLGGQNLALRSVSTVSHQAVTKRRMVTESRTVTDGAVTKEEQRERVKKAVVQRTVVSPNLAKKWREVCGATDWKDMLDPLDADVRNELIRYGEFTQATYDSFDSDEHSKYKGSCRHCKETFLERAGLPDTGYEVTKYLYTTSDIKSLLLRNEHEEAWCRASNWMGYVAVCTDEERIKQLGRRDIVVVWRGTIEKLEWAANLKRNVIPSSLDDRDTSDGDVLHPKIGMEEGFLSLYTSKNTQLYNQKSAREQLLCEIRRLIKMYDDETLSITTTGHSLGAALALLSAYDIAESGINRHYRTPPVPSKWNQQTESTPSSNPAKTMESKSVPITCFSFAGPRVGNSPFADRVKQLGVKVLRVVNKNDFVPKVPGLIFSGIREELGILDKLIEQLPWTYSHCGLELELNNEHSPFLRPKPGVGNVHNLEGYLHMVAGYQGKGIGIGPDFKLQVRRDIALVNKSSDALVPQKYIPNCWWQLENKGLVLNENYEWVQMERITEDIPVPEDDEDED